MLAYRRGIVVPLTKTSLSNIRNGTETEGDRVELIQLNDDGLFYRLWEIGIFNHVNKICDSLVDDYEEVEVQQNLNELWKMVHGFADQEGLNFNSEIISFLRKFELLIKVAIRRDMPIFFVF